MERKPYPSDVRDDEWTFVAPYLILMTEDAPQRDHRLREVFNGLRWIVRAGAAWRMMPPDLPPWYTVSPQSQRWFKAGGFETMGIDLRELHRVVQGRNPQPSAAIVDSRALPSTPESGWRAGFNPANSRRGSKVERAVETLGNLLALLVTPANEQERHQVAELAKHVQEATGDSVELAFVDQAYTGERAAQDAAAHHMELEVVKLPEAKRGFVLLPRRWVVGVSSKGHMNPVGESPTEVISSSLVAWEAPWREINTVKPSDTMLFGSMRNTPGGNVQ